ncbi:unnamed protein product [Gongylonema pulchrum]|uniref:Secreted protein n=1 Tax=Gongylonema pulchrum TaxID=637853 RepID=A0A183E721_9BILA|nr:unnamed protein product [Gongylonema pulchrum]
MILVLSVQWSLRDVRYRTKLIAVAPSSTAASGEYAHLPKSALAAACVCTRLGLQKLELLGQALLDSGDRSWKWTMIDCFCLKCTQLLGPEAQRFWPNPAEAN